MNGDIGFFGLQDWWLNSFSKDERDYIEQKFHPLGLDTNTKPLTEGKISSTSQTPAGLLWALAGWFNNPKDRNIARRIIDKAYQLASAGKDITDLHFTLQMIIKICYPDRNTDPDALEKAIWACREQIKIAPLVIEAFRKEGWKDMPAHIGYNQLRVILKNQHKYKEALELCKQAKSQGLTGNWEKEITFFANKISKSPK